MNTKNSIIIDHDKCTGCGLCVTDCTVGIISVEDGKAAVADNVCLECDHCVAICPHGAVSCARSDECIEYESEKFDIDPEKLLNAMRFRRSIRRYQDKKVDDETLDKILTAGRYSPTGSNRQPLRFIVIDRESEKIKKLAMKELGIFASNEPIGPKMRTKRIQSIFMNMLDEYETTGRDRLFFNAPQVIVIAADTNLGGRPFVDGGISGSYMELMANALGLGTCYLGFLHTASEVSDTVREALGLKENEIVAAAFTLGYPAHKYSRTAGRAAQPVAKY